MEQHMVLIADSSEEFCTELQAALRWSCQCRSCRSGKQVLQLVTELHPDILVVDLMLPEMDGISILKALSLCADRPRVLATTYVLSNYILESAERLNVDYLMTKPCSIAATAARIQEQLQQLEESREDTDEIPLRIAGLLMMMGFSGKLHGFRYLQEAIALVLKDPGQSITKELYPGVGRLCRTAGSHVERSIRGSIQDAWKRRDDRIWQLYFPPDGTGKIGKPTNAAFITRIADGLRISLGSENSMEFIPAEDSRSQLLSRCQ